MSRRLIETTPHVYFFAALLLVICSRDLTAEGIRPVALAKRELPCPLWGTNVVMSPDGSLLATSAGKSGDLQIFDVSPTKSVLKYTLSAEEADEPLAIIGQNKALIYRSGRGTLRVCTLPEKRVAFSIDAVFDFQKPAGQQFAIARDESCIAVTSRNKSIAIHSLKDGEQIHEFLPLPPGTFFVHPQFSRSGEELVAICTGAGTWSTVMAWNLATRKERRVRTLEGYLKTIHQYSLSPYGKYLAMLGRGDSKGKQDLVVIELESGAVIGKLAVDSYKPNGFAFSSDETRLVLAKPEEGCVEVLDVELNKAERRLLGGRSEGLTQIVINDSRSIVMAANDNGIRIWNAETEAPYAYTQGVESVTNLAFGNQDRELLADGTDGVWIWNVKTRQVIGRRPNCGLARWNPVGTSLVCVDSELKIEIGTRQTDGFVFRSTGHTIELLDPGSVMTSYGPAHYPRQLEDFVVRPDNTILYGDHVGNLMTLDGRTGKSRLALKSSETTVIYPFRKVAEKELIRFAVLNKSNSVDGTPRLISQGQDIVELDLSSGKVRTCVRATSAAQTFINSTGIVCAVATLRSSTGDPWPVQIWNLNSAKQIAEIDCTPWRLDAVRSAIQNGSQVVVSPNGQLLAVAGQDDVVYVYGVGNKKKDISIVSDDMLDLQSLAFSSDSSTLAIACRGGAIYIVELSRPMP